MAAHDALDPRPDLINDTAHWTFVLDRAFTFDGTDPIGLYGTLLGFRCLGAELIETPTGWRLVAGEMPVDEYTGLRDRYLLPRASQVRRLLSELAVGNRAA